MTERKALSTEPYKGVRDFYPADWAKLSAVFDKTRTFLKSWGYEEYQASPLEAAELYESKGNDEIVREQTFTFTDRGDRRVTLRPEMTPSLARMVAGKRRELTFPLRWFSIGNRFRYERPQRGRLREFYQTDIDLIGLPEGEADLEVITIASELLKFFGAKESEFSIRVNSRALLTTACKAAGLSDQEGMREYWRLLDKKAKMSAEEFEKERGATADPLSLIENDDPSIKQEKDKLMATIAALKERGVGNVVFDPEVVRGFDYYTGVIFEIFDTNPENTRSMFGGGRYDGLVTLFGGDPIPAVGFAFGDVILMDFLETHGHTVEAEASADLFLAGLNFEDLPKVQKIAKKLRVPNNRVYVSLVPRSIGDQIKEATRRGIRYFAVYGESEQSSGLIEVKDLPARTAKTYKLDEFGKL